MGVKRFDQCDFQARLPLKGSLDPYLPPYESLIKQWLLMVILKFLQHVSRRDLE